MDEHEATRAYEHAAHMRLWFELSTTPDYRHSIDKASSAHHWALHLILRDNDRAEGPLW